MTDPQIPDPLKIGRKVLAPEHSSTLQTGFYMGALLIVVMMSSLFVANHVPASEHYALERNAASYALFVLFMLIPIARFFNRPARMFMSALIGWALFVVAYNIAGMFYQNLFQLLRRQPFQVFIEGGLAYGFVAVGSWVAEMCLHARRNPIAPRRRRTDHLHQQP